MATPKGFNERSSLIDVCGFYFRASFNSVTPGATI